MRFARDVLAFEAVAARGPEHEAPALVTQRRGEPVDLRLRGQRDGLLRRQTEEAPDAVDEARDIVVLERVVEREHRHAVADLLELLGRCRAEAFRRAVVADQRREARFDRGVALAQRVVVGVGDRGGVFLVIRDVVLRDLGREAFELGGGFGLRELIDRCGGGGSPGLAAHRLRILRAAASGTRGSQYSSRGAGCGIFPRRVVLRATSGRGIRDLHNQAVFALAVVLSAAALAQNQPQPVDESLAAYADTTHSVTT